MKSRRTNPLFRPEAEPATRPHGSWAEVVQVEDVLLLVWLLVVEGLLLRFSDRSPIAWIEPAGDGLPWTAWLLILSLAFLVFTGGSRDRTVDGGIFRRILLVGPLFPVLSVVVAVVSLIRGGPRSVVRLGGDEAEWPMPRVPDWLRRTAAVPAILVGESGFRAALTSSVPHLLAGMSPGGMKGAAGVAFGLLTLVVAFAIAVMGPRIAAGATTDWRFWVTRFALFAAAATASPL
jgi:hypothetical protein